MCFLNLPLAKCFRKMVSKVIFSGQRLSPNWWWGKMGNGKKIKGREGKGKKGRERREGTGRAGQGREGKGSSDCSPCRWWQWTGWGVSCRFLGGCPTMCQGLELNCTLNCTLLYTELSFTDQGTVLHCLLSCTAWHIEMYFSSQGTVFQRKPNCTSLHTDIYCTAHITLFTVLNYTIECTVLHCTLSLAILSVISAQHTALFIIIQGRLPVWNCYLP